MLMHASLALTWIFFFPGGGGGGFYSSGRSSKQFGFQGLAGKEARDFFREEWVEKPGTTISKEGLEEVVVLMETEEMVEVEEATLEEVAV